MREDIDKLNGMTERELLLIIMTKQDQMVKDIQQLSNILVTKADASKLSELETDIKELQKENSEIKRMQWIATGAVGVFVWAVEHFLV